MFEWAGIVFCQPIKLHVWTYNHSGVSSSLPNKFGLVQLVHQATVNTKTLSGPHACTILILDTTGLRKVKSLANSNYFQNAKVNLCSTFIICPIMSLCIYSCRCTHSICYTLVNFFSHQTLYKLFSYFLVNFNRFSKVY